VEGVIKRVGTKLVRGLSAAAVLIALIRPAFPVTRASATIGGPYNVVVVEVDDLDSALLNTAIVHGFMPMLAQLANSGTQFTNSFVSDSVCCPSRATLLTGLYAHNTGVHHEDCTSFQAPANGDHEASTLATWLQSKGIPNNYYTGFVGKYLNGYGTNDSFPSTDCRNKLYVPPGWNEWHGITGAFARETGYTLNDTVNGVTTLWGPDPCQGYLCDYQTSVLGQRASDFLTRAYPTGRPFFLWVTPTAPHLESATNVSLLDCAFNAPSAPPTRTPFGPCNRTPTWPMA
jgi:N-acetylglucosamine-6-sulfatase